MHHFVHYRKEAVPEVCNRNTETLKSHFQVALGVPREAPLENTVLHSS